MSTAGAGLRLVADSLAELAETWSDPALLRSLLRDLGWSVTDLPPALQTIAAPASSLAAAWEAVRHEDEPALEMLAPVAIAVGDVWRALRALESQPAPAGLEDLFGELARSLFDYFVIETVARRGHFVLPLLELVGIVEIDHVDAAPPKAAFIRRRIVWERVPALLSDPAIGFRARFGWGTPTFDAGAVLAKLRDLLGALRWSAALVEADPHELATTGDASTERVLAVDLQLLTAVREAGFVEAGVRFLPLSPAGELPGLALVPYISPALGASFPLDDHVSASINASFDLQGGVAATWLPDHGIRLITNISGGGTAHATGRAVFTLSIDDPAKPEKRLLDGFGFQLVAKTAQGSARLELEPEPELAIEAEIKDGVARWDPSAAPSVLGSLLGGQPVEMQARLGIGWSSTRGFYLRGGDAAGLTIPIGRQLGPFELRALRVGVARIEDGAALDLGIDGAVTVGPVEVGWEGLGVRFAIARGTDLPVDLDIDAAFPSTITFAVDSPLLTGGGAIRRIDSDHYAGALTLRAFRIDVTATASVARTPAGVSIAALVAAHWPGIPIGLGFTLDGMMGIVGIRRRIAIEQCRARLRSGGISALLAGSDPATTLAALDDIFPIAAGRHVIGLGPTIGWGSPAMVRADLAVLVEVPAPIKIVLLGALRIGLPSLAKAVVDLRLDALGVIDLARGTLAVDASLHDSTLAGYALTGDMAVRIGWREDPQFLISIGGFHPAFHPPAGFPTLRRIQLVIGDNPQLTVQSYLAITSNTVQIGARADLVFRGGGFEIAGRLGFDALLELVPFHFEVDIQARASIRYHSLRLASVKLDFVLSGPRPWHANGEATFGVLWWDVTVGFDVTWGDATPAALPPPPDIAAALRTALQRPDAWTSELPAGEPPWIVVGDREGIRVHPLARVVVRQRVVPLDYPIGQFGSVPLAAPQRFAIEHVRVAPSTTFVNAPPVQDRFAPGQFTQLDTADRLAAPAFEEFASGVHLGEHELAHGPDARATMDVTTRVIDPLAPPIKPPLHTRDFADVRAARPSRGAAPTIPVAVPTVRDLGFVLASTDDLTITAEGAAIARGATSHAALREALRERTTVTGRRAALQIVPRIEAANRDERVVPVRDGDSLRGIDFVDTVTGEPMTRAQLVEKIQTTDRYPEYTLRSIGGVVSPIRRRRS